MLEMVFFYRFFITVIVKLLTHTSINILKKVWFVLISLLLHNRGEMLKNVLFPAHFHLRCPSVACAIIIKLLWKKEWKKKLEKKTQLKVMCKVLDLFSATFPLYLRRKNIWHIHLIFMTFPVKYLHLNYTYTHTYMRTYLWAHQNAKCRKYKREVSHLRVYAWMYACVEVFVHKEQGISGQQRPVCVCVASTENWFSTEKSCNMNMKVCENYWNSTILCINILKRSFQHCGILFYSSNTSYIHTCTPRNMLGKSK